MLRDICPSRDDAQSHIVENGRCVMCFKPLTETNRYQVVAHHGENCSIFSVVDTVQPEPEQPAVVLEFSTHINHNAKFLADDFCARHNAKER